MSYSKATVRISAEEGMGFSCFSQLMRVCRTLMKLFRASYSRMKVPRATSKSPSGNPMRLPLRIHGWTLAGNYRKKPSQHTVRGDARYGRFDTKEACSN